MKSCVCTLLIVLFFSGQAQAGLNLQQAYQELQYELTVAWDQKDEEFRDQAIRHFTSMVAAARPSEVSELLAALAIEQEMSLEHLVESVRRQQLLHQGASWNGRGKWVLGAATVAAGILVYYYIAASRISY
jgi:glycine cleavage system regulatory protein